MASVIVNTVTYDTLASVAEADAQLIVDPLNGPAWALYTTDQKGIFLISATRFMLTSLSWCGDVPTTDEPVDPLIKSVCILFAAAIGADPTILSGPTGDGEIKSAKAGSAAVEFFRGEAVIGGAPSGFPIGLWNMLKAAGVVGCTDGSLAAPFIIGGDCCSYFEGYYSHGCSTCAPLAKCQCSGYMPCG